MSKIKAAMFSSFLAAVGGCASAPDKRLAGVDVQDEDLRKAIEQCTQHISFNFQAGAEIKQLPIVKWTDDDCVERVRKAAPMIREINRRLKEMGIVL